MSTVRRCFVSTPARDAAATWEAIVALLMQGRDGAEKNELLAVTGIAASIITDQAPREAAIVVTCDGPRTRIYCLFDDAALDGGDANEDALGFNPLKGDWALSLPCDAADLAWVQSALKAHSTRITARDKALSITLEEEKSASQSGALILDPKGFLGA